MVSNPPVSFKLKERILRALVLHGSPFVVLVSVRTIFAAYFRRLMGCRFKLIVPFRRVHYEQVRTGLVGQSFFDSVFVCYKCGPRAKISYAADDRL